MDTFDLTKDVAEKLLLRVMGPFRKAMGENKPKEGEEWDDELEVVFTLGEIRELDRDLGSLGLTLANRYAEQEEYRTTLAVMAEENVRLHGALSAMSALLEKEKEQSESLAGALAKERNVSHKLKEVTGFKSSML